MLIADEGDKLLMIPGPTPVQREILAALSEPTISHTSSALAEIIAPCLQSLSALAGASRGQSFVFGGAGTLAQEAALVNTVAAGERLLVVSNGFFSDRFLPMAEAHGILVDRLAAPWGRSVTPDELRAQMTTARYRAVTITQVETSTGVLAPVSELAAVAREFGAYVLVDAVCGLGGVPLDMDRDGLHIVLSGAQKALGVPPGLAILIASEAALARRREMGRITAYYADLLPWLPSMQDPTVYFSTHAVNLFYALRVALNIIETEGLAERYARHQRLSAEFRAGMAALGFASLTRECDLAPTLSVLAYPNGLDDAGFRAALSKRGVVAAGCLGEFKGRGARFGHMGNISETEILQALAAVEDSLRESELPVEPGSALAAARAAGQMNAGVTLGAGTTAG